MGHDPKLDNDPGLWPERLVCNWQWLPMDTAPKDGTRILIKAVTFAWSSDICQHVATGDAAIEARWAKGMGGGKDPDWREWCGREGTHSTRSITPLGWAPLPK